MRSSNYWGSGKGSPDWRGNSSSHTMGDGGVKETGFSGPEGRDLMPRSSIIQGQVIMIHHGRGMTHPWYCTASRPSSLQATHLLYPSPEGHSPPPISHTQGLPPTSCQPHARVVILSFSDSTLQPFHPPYLGLFLQLSLELLQLLGEGLLAFG